MMTKETFDLLVQQHTGTIDEIRQAAHALHDSVNQTYDRTKPYGLHLDMVARSVFDYGYLVCTTGQDVLPLFFGAFFHDSIEDARQTYNDVMQIALRWLDRQQALLATEIVYALTNDKGRTREERAGERYYQGIRQTPYAPFVKLADRLANVSYSCSSDEARNRHMRDVYAREMPHFLASIDAQSNDPRLSLPRVMIEHIKQLLQASILA